MLLETDRLILRDWQDDDIAPMTTINQDPKVMRYFPGLQDLAKTKQFIANAKAHIKQHGFGWFAIELKQSQTFIGFVGIRTVAFEARFTPAIEIGWRIASDHWGHGYAPEAAQRVLAFAFNELRLDEIVSFAVSTNYPSRRVMEKIGLHHVPNEDFNHPIFAKDSPLSRHVFYHLLKTEYLAITQAK